MHKVAILFTHIPIAIRTLERFHLTDTADVQAITQGPGVPAIRRFDLDYHLVDIFDRKALANALKGCDTVIHPGSEDAHTLLKSAPNCYLAATDAAVARMIFVSSAFVHGLSPEASTTESAAFKKSIKSPSVNACIQSEITLKQLRKNGSTELIVLRPGIVFGPRCIWTVGLADDLMNKRANLLNGGQGVCNSTYIDNLVHALVLSMTASATAVDKQQFFIGDKDQVSWLDFYSAIALPLGIDLAMLADRESIGFSNSIDRPFSFPSALISRLQSCSLSFWKQGFSSILAKCADPRPNIYTATAVQTNTLPAEISELQQCQHKLSLQKAEEQLGYTEIVSPRESCQRSIAWLDFSGYPILNTKS